MEMIKINTEITYITKNELKYDSMYKNIEDITISDIGNRNIIQEACVLIITIISKSGQYQQKLLKSRY